jgi:hypothetical protein
LGGTGSVDFVTIATVSVAVVIEVKTRTYHKRHLARVGEQLA